MPPWPDDYEPYGPVQVSYYSVLDLLCDMLLAYCNWFCD